MDKVFVHNKLEATTLINEAFVAGDEEKYDGARFFTHDGDFIFKCIIRTDSSFDMMFNDGQVYNKEVVF